MDELIRSRIHEALEVEPPAGLRSRVIASVPMTSPGTSRPRQRSPQWAGQLAGGVVAALLAIAIVVGLLYSRGALSTAGPNAGPQHPSPPSLIWPEGVAVGLDGTVYVSDIAGDRVFKVMSDGSLVTVAGGGTSRDGPATKAWLNHPSGLAIDPSGNLYVADSQGFAIQRIDRRGIISTFVEGMSTVYAPLGLAFDSSGALYVSRLDGEVRRIDKDRTVSSLDVSSLPPPALAPGYLAFDAAGNLYVADRAPGPTEDVRFTSTLGGCRIVRVAPDKELSVIAGTGKCGFSGDGGPATSAQLNDPNGIVFDSVGNLYFADTYNHRIRRIDKNGIITTVAGTGIAGYGGDGGPATQADLAYPFGMGIKSGNLVYIADASCYCMNPISGSHLRLLNLSNGMISTVAT